MNSCRSAPIGSSHPRASAVNASVQSLFAKRPPAAPPLTGSPIPPVRAAVPPVRKTVPPAPRPPVTAPRSTAPKDPYEWSEDETPPKLVKGPLGAKTSNSRGFQDDGEDATDDDGGVGSKPWFWPASRDSKPAANATSAPPSRTTLPSKPLSAVAPVVRPPANHHQQPTHPAPQVSQMTIAKPSPGSDSSSSKGMVPRDQKHVRNLFGSCFAQLNSILVSFES